MILEHGYTHQARYMRFEENADGTVTGIPCGTHPMEAAAAFANRLSELRQSGFLVLDCDHGTWVATQMDTRKPFEAVKLSLVSELVNVMN